jgi:hypothetical protein
MARVLERREVEEAVPERVEPLEEPRLLFEAPVLVEPGA